MSDQYWKDGRYNGMTFEEFVAKSHEVMATNRRIEEALRADVSKLEARYLAEFDRVTAYVGAINAVRDRYPEDVFPSHSNTPDAASGRFARMICDEIDRLAHE